MTVEAFESVDEFYRADDRRRRSRELDFGVWWFDARVPGVPWRVSWVEATGEVYALALARARVAVFRNRIVAVQNGPEIGPLIVLAIVIGEADVERRLRGWTDVCGGKQSLDWVREVLLNDSV